MVAARSTCAPDVDVSDSLSLLEQEPQPRNAGRRQLLGQAHLLDLLEHAAHLLVQSSRIGLDPNGQRRDPGPGQAVDRIRVGPKRDRSSLRQHALARRLIAGRVGELRPDQKHPDRRGLLLFEHLEMPPRLGHVGRAVHRVPSSAST